MTRLDCFSNTATRQRKRHLDETCGRLRCSSVCIYHAHMNGAQSFSFGEYNRDLSAQQKDGIRPLVEASLGCVTDEVRYRHIEDELTLWTRCEKEVY